MLIIFSMLDISVSIVLYLISNWLYVPHLAFVSMHMYRDEKCLESLMEK